MSINLSSPSFWLGVVVFFYGVEAAHRYLRYRVKAHLRAEKDPYQGWTRTHTGRIDCPKCDDVMTLSEDRALAKCGACGFESTEMADPKRWTSIETLTRKVADEN